MNGERMKPDTEPPVGSLEWTERFQLRMALESTPAQRRQDLQDRLDFNWEAEACNLQLRWARARRWARTRRWVKARLKNK